MGRAWGGVKGLASSAWNGMQNFANRAGNWINDKGFKTDGELAQEEANRRIAVQAAMGYMDAAGKQRETYNFYTDIGSVTKVLRGGYYQEDAEQTSNDLRRRINQELGTDFKNGKEINAAVQSGQISPDQLRTATENYVAEKGGDRGLSEFGRVNELNNGLANGELKTVNGKIVDSAGNTVGSIWKDGALVSRADEQYKLEMRKQWEQTQGAHSFLAADASNMRAESARQSVADQTSFLNGVGNFLKASNITFVNGGPGTYISHSAYHYQNQGYSVERSQQI